MKINWLWDTQISEKEAENILKDAKHPKFDIYAEKLLSRVSDTTTVFHFINKKVFCQKWPTLKKSMQKDQWLKTRITFWQTIYDRLYEKFKQQGVKIREPLKIKIPEERKLVAQQIRQTREKLGYTQKEMAKKLGVIQQYISKLETGHENFSVDTLKQVAKAFNKKLIIKFSS